MCDKTPVEDTEDKELDDLLNSALNDFNETLTRKKEDTEDPKGTKDTKDTKDGSDANLTEAESERNTFESLDEAWTRDFIKQAAEQFEENFQNLIRNGADSELAASFEKTAQQVASVINDADGSSADNTSGDFQSTITRALNDLTAASESMQGENDLSALFGQTSLEDGAGAILPFMQGMLQHLLSKEMLYPSLKELVDKYSEWLNEKGTALNPAELERYTKQLELMRKVCEELDKEKDEDTEDVKKQRFETVISLMDRMQGYGQLPEELGGEQLAPFQMDGEGDSVLPPLLRSMNSSRDCRLM